MADLFWFSDTQWARIAPLLPSNARGLKRVDDRRVLSGIVQVIRSGGRWADAPGAYGPKKTRLITASCAGRTAASGKGYSPPLPVRVMFPTG